MASTVRSVTVRLDALVSKYVADMRLAGRETDKAFASAHASLASTNRELGISHSRLGVVNSDLAMTNRRVLTLGQRLTPVTSSLSTLNGSGLGSLPALGRNTQTAGNQIDRMSGRLRIFADLAAVLGPGLIPIAAVGVPALTGLAAGFGFTAVGAVSLIASVQGVGDALKLVNKAALEPTTENLRAAQEALADLSPEAARFVTEARDLGPLLKDLRDTGAEEFFPGAIRGMKELRNLAPELEAILSRTSGTIGDLLAGDAESLTSGRWQDFFDFLANETSETLVVLNQILGDVAHGAAEMWLAFDPANDAFLDWVAGVADGFDDWASSEQGRREIAEFLAYARENGPAVAEAFGSIGNMLLEVVKAASPLGGPVLQSLAAVADVVAAIAESDLGTPLFVGLAAMSLLTRATALWGAVSKTAAGKFIAGQTMATTSLNGTKLSMAGIGKYAALFGGIALASSDMGKSFELSNTASLALMGTMAGPWGTAAGAAVGFTMDLAAANDSMADALVRVNQAFESGTIAEQRDALRGLKDSTDEAAAGLGDLLASGADKDLSAMANSIIPAAFSAFNILTGSIGDARREHDEFKASINNRAFLKDALIGPLGLTAGAYREATGSALSFRDAVIQVNNVLAGRASFRDYEAALDDLAKSLRKIDESKLLTKGGKINIDLPKGREVQEQLDGIAATAIKVAENLKGADRDNFLARARKDFVQVATLLLGDRDAARALADELGLLDKKKAKPEVDADTKPAKEKLSAIERDLDLWDSASGEATATVNGREALATLFGIKSGLDKIQSKTVFVNVLTRRSNEGGGFGPVGGADGMTVPGQRMPYGDKTLIWAAPGEEVITNRNGEADHFRADRASGRIPGYTNGGPVAATAKMTDIRGRYGFDVVARTAAQAADSLGALSGMGKKELAQREKELTQRERLLTKELAHAEKRMQAEIDEFRQLKDARRSLADASSGNFMSEVFVEGATPESILAALKAEEGDAQAFATAMNILQDNLGFDGGAFQELSSSGNLAAAQALAQMSAAEIDALEQAYAQRNAQAQLVGTIAGSDLGDEVRKQRKATEESRDAVRELKTELKAIDRRQERMERLAERNPEETGEATGRAVRDAARDGRKRGAA